MALYDNHIHIAQIDKAAEEFHSCMLRMANLSEESTLISVNPPFNFPLKRKFKPNKPQNLTPHLGTDQNDNQQFPVLRPRRHSEPPCDATKYLKKNANQL
jgi:hypothetical protein